MGVAAVASAAYLAAAGATGVAPIPRQAGASRQTAANSLWDQMERGPHTGSLQDALVGVEVTAASSDGAVKRIHRGTGLILRCDGFVLVPTALFNTALDVAGSKEEASGLQITI